MRRVARGLDTEWTVHGHNDGRRGPRNDQRNWWKTTKEIGGKTDSDRVGQKMAPGNGNERSTTVDNAGRGRPCQSQRIKAGTRMLREERLSQETADPEIQSSQETASRTRGKEPLARRGAGSSRRPRARGQATDAHQPLAGDRVGMELPPSRGGKGLDSRIPSSSPGVGSHPQGEGRGEEQRVGRRERG